MTATSVSSKCRKPEDLRIRQSGEHEPSAGVDRSVGQVPAVRRRRPRSPPTERDVIAPGKRRLKSGAEGTGSQDWAPNSLCRMVTGVQGERHFVNNPRVCAGRPWRAPRGNEGPFEDRLLARAAPIRTATVRSREKIGWQAKAPNAAYFAHRSILQ